MFELDDIRPYCTFSTFYNILNDTDVYALKVKHPNLKQTYAVQIGVSRLAYTFGFESQTAREYLIRDQLLTKVLHDINS